MKLTLHSYFETGKMMSKQWEEEVIYFNVKILLSFNKAILVQKIKIIINRQNDSQELSEGF